MSTEPITMTDTGIHLPTTASSSSSTSVSSAAPATTPASLLTSLLSLPPRASKRRRGSRFKAADEPAAGAEMEDTATAAATSAESQLPNDDDSSSSSSSSTSRPPMREKKFEYLDHTADIQLHSWGETLTEALEQCVLSMFSYITDISRVDIDPTRTDTFEVKAHDMDSLLFTLLDEFLYRFATNEWIIRDLRIEKLDLTNFSIRVTGFGEHFTLDKHPQGTEIKAITYSNMQIYVEGRRVKSDNSNQQQQQQEEEMTPEQIAQRGTHKADVYVIVDI